MNLSAIRPFTNLINRVPNLNSVYIDTEGGGGFDLNGLVEMARRKRMMQEAGANVAGRRQELIEQGRMGPQPLANREAASEAVFERLKFPQNKEIAALGLPTTVQEVPGIGRRVDYDGGRVMLGKYGTGFAVDKPYTGATINPKQGSNIPVATAAPATPATPVDSAQPATSTAKPKVDTVNAPQAPKSGKAVVTAAMSPAKVSTPSAENEKKTEAKLIKQAFDKAKSLEVPSDSEGYKTPNSSIYSQNGAYIENARRYYELTGDDSLIKQYLNANPSEAKRALLREGAAWKEVSQNINEEQEKMKQVEAARKSREDFIKANSSTPFTEGAAAQLWETLNPELAANLHIDPVDLKRASDKKDRNYNEALVNNLKYLEERYKQMNELGLR